MDGRGGGGSVRGDRGGPVPVHHRWPAGRRGPDRPVPCAAPRRRGCKDDYAVNVSGIMPLRLVFRAVWAVGLSPFSPVNLGRAVTRRRACKAAVSPSGRIILTFTGMRRRHGQAAHRTGPEGGGAGRGALP